MIWAVRELVFEILNGFFVCGEEVSLNDESLIRKHIDDTLSSNQESNRHGM